MRGRERTPGVRECRDHGPDINRARRALMTMFKWGEDRAYSAIRRLAMTLRRKREDVARRLLDGRIPWSAAADPAGLRGHTYKGDGGGVAVNDARKAAGLP